MLNSTKYSSVNNYFNYFTEIEERYLKRRGSGLLLSTIDWALIETWKDAGIPLDAVLRGIDETFDKYERRPSKTKKINSLAYCAQEVLGAAEDMQEAAVGATREKTDSGPGLGSPEIVAYLSANAEKLRQIGSSTQVKAIAAECAASLEELAGAVKAGSATVKLEDLERRMTILEEKLMAVLTVAAPQEQLVKLRTEADREIAPYRSKMPASQIDQLLKQFVHKRLLEQAKMPRLSLFYM
ncbi:MAG TPA: hypothetical protein VFR08_04260 [Candidatus Angelobacter sp.]|nr:hypothetical protein [Candidatus Angelobacter sp.]